MFFMVTMLDGLKTLNALKTLYFILFILCVFLDVCILLRYVKQKNEGEYSL